MFGMNIFTKSSQKQEGQEAPKPRNIDDTLKLVDYKGQPGTVEITFDSTYSIFGVVESHIKKKKLPDSKYHVSSGSITGTVSIKEGVSITQGKRRQGIPSDMIYPNTEILFYQDGKLVFDKVRLKQTLNGGTKGFIKEVREAFRKLDDCNLVVKTYPTSVLEVGINYS